jgi:carboxyl-terminal processing protease
LQDNKRAIIVGTKTFGKGLVQSVHSLSDGSGMAVTIAKYYTPSGRDINKKGIEPDRIVELTKEDLERLNKNRDLVGTSADPQFAKAVDVLANELKSANSR